MQIIKKFFSGRQVFFTPLVILGALICCGLGAWQWDRHNQRIALNQRITSRMAEETIVLQPDVISTIDAERFDYRWVEVRGSFDNQQAVLLRNRSYDGSTGYHLLVPFRIEGSDQAVLIDRGWVPFTIDSKQALGVEPISGIQTLKGVARKSEEEIQGGPVDPPFSAERPRLDAWFRVNLSRIEQQAGYPLLPIFIELQPEGNDITPPIPTATTDLGPGSHLNYTLQWYSFAVILVIGYGFVVIRGLPKRGSSTPGNPAARKGTA
jgi:surfeit locus 1 family protein